MGGGIQFESYFLGEFGWFLVAFCYLGLFILIRRFVQEKANEFKTKTA